MNEFAPRFTNTPEHKEKIGNKEKVGHTFQIREKEPVITNESKEFVRQEFLTLGRELSESGKHFPFDFEKGISTESYAQLKRDDAECPGFVTPIDTLREKFRDGGMRVALSPNPGNLDVFIIPADSGDLEVALEEDSLLPRHLEESIITDHPELQQLVWLSKVLKGEK